MVDREVILVTGANGQLGMELRTAAEAFPQYDFIFLSREQLAIEDGEALEKVFLKQQPEYCINCAAYTAVDKAEAENELALLINGTAVGLLANTCKKFQTTLIHISTDYVFNGQSTVPYKEADETDPVNFYGASKLEGERLAMEFGDDVIIIRTSWVYSSHGKNFVNTMLRLMKEKKELSVVNDQFGAPTSATDLAHAILNIITHLSLHKGQPAQNFRGIYHYSNEGMITWYEFAEAIKEITSGTTIIHPITTAEFPTPAKRPAWSVLDKQKIVDTFGIELQEWKESLKNCLVAGKHL
jgi:dTDP-4-dehydrorhamnose reductase